jgi:hypothetical protein
MRLTAQTFAFALAFGVALLVAAAGPASIDLSWLP